MERTVSSLAPHFLASAAAIDTDGLLDIPEEITSISSPPVPHFLASAAAIRTDGSLLETPADTISDFPGFCPPVIMVPESGTSSATYKWYE